MRQNQKRSRNIQRTFTKAIRKHVSGKRVLHLGCVGHSASKRHSEPWLHQYLLDHAEEVVGVDILKSEVQELRAAGYNVVLGDAEDLDLGSRFDVIVAGELIEHLTDFGGFLKSIDNHLASDGVVIITTPNALAVHWTILRLLNVKFVNTEHTCWFDSTTLSQLLQRYGFKTIETTYVGDCSFTISDPLQAIGWFVERILPARIGRSTLVMTSRRVGQ